MSHIFSMDFLRFDLGRNLSEVGRYPGFLTHASPVGTVQPWARVRDPSAVAGRVADST
jgi:hypothetical protein